MTEQPVRSFFRVYAIYLAWLVSIVAVSGSLYLSEVLHYEPCRLCWFQRIFMYPQLIMLGIAGYRNDRNIIPYLLPINIIGGCISLYHYGMQKIPALAEILPCTVGVPCDKDYINLLGFITIPLMALVAFIMITVLLLIAKRQPVQTEE